MRRIVVFIAASLCASPAFGLQCTGLYCYEAESGSYGGASFQNATPGYSGTGYVSFNNHETSSYVQVSAAVPQGLYELWFGYNAPNGFKGYDYQVNGLGGSGGFDFNGSQFGVDRAGVFNLTLPTNTLRINRGWGWFNVDYFELRPFTPPTVLPVSTQLSDELATSNTQALMNYLTDIYGNKTLSGHQGEVGKTDPFPTQDFLNKSGGIVPAIRGSDFIDYSPTRLQYGANPNGETERVIKWARQTGGIPTMMWHWNAPANLVNSSEWPWWSGFYTDATTFDLAGALANPSGSDYQLILRDIDAIGTQLKKFQDAGVSVIWRPLHEAQGNATDATGTGAWFWWGADGPAALKDLWRVMHDRLTNYHGLHNLIWEFTSSAGQGNWLDWYPGDDVVDMVGLDVYTDPSSSMSGQWYDVLAQFNGRKMIALSETGTMPDPDLLDTYGIGWSYISPWTWSYVKDQYYAAGYSDAQIQAVLQELLSDEDIVTLNELPLMPWSALDFNRDGIVDSADYVVWRKMNGQIAPNLAADANQDGRVNNADFVLWKANFGRVAFNGGSGAIASPAVPEPASIALLCVGAVLAVSRRIRWVPCPRLCVGMER